jgi:hypothetical protein
MNRTFNGIWADLRNRLRAGTVIRNWSADSGYTGGEFRVNDVDGSAIVVRSGQMGQERRVGRRDFEMLFALWGAYNRGAVSRAELGKRSQNTTYVLSILHWREDTQNAPRQQSTPRPSAISPMPAPPRQAELLVKKRPDTTSTGNASCAPLPRRL